MRKTDERKVLRDPIHGYIHVDLQVIWDCINTKEMQRLRRIRQLGGDFQVYHTAEHSRFSHSLGVYEIVRRMVYEIESLCTAMSEYDKAVAMLAGLLHDIGHGPFSHAFETIQHFHHETYSVKIILEDSEVHRVLTAHHPSLPNDIAAIMQHRHPLEFMNQLVSGQLDADRMDYLLRDAYFTGTSYGNFDLERILRTMRLKDGRIVVKQSGIHSVEDYIMARYHMYWQVYLHPVARSYETMLTMLFKRMKFVYEKGLLDEAMTCMFLPFLKDCGASIDDLHMLDEAAAQYGISCLRKGSDPILRDLSYRLMNRKLFEYCPMKSQAEYEKVVSNVKALGYDPHYFVHHDSVSQLPYSLYTGKDGHNIWVLCEQGVIKELSEVSAIVYALATANFKEEEMLYYPIEKLNV